MKTTIIVAIIVVAGLVGYFTYKHSDTDSMALSSSPSVSASPSFEASASFSPSPSTSPSTKSFTVDGRNFSFSPSSIIVNKGDHVSITFTDESGTHNLFIEGYNIKTQTISGGQSQTLNFVADKAGTFQFYCTVDSHRELGMVGTLTVQ